jgi:hypothetical protein
MFCIVAHHCSPSVPDSPPSSRGEGVYSTDIYLEEADWFAHRRLDVQRLDILPIFLQQRDKEIDAWCDECKKKSSKAGDK